MSTKSNKTNLRIKINTTLLFVMSIVFGVMTFTTASNIFNASKNFQSVSDTLTIASLVATIIYWNHNKAKK